MQHTTPPPPLQRATSAIQPLNHREITSEHRQRRKRAGIALSNRQAEKRAAQDDVELQLDDLRDFTRAVSAPSSDSLNWTDGQTESRSARLYQQKSLCENEMDAVLREYASKCSTQQLQTMRAAVGEQCRQALTVLTRVRSIPRLGQELGAQALPIDKYLVLAIIAYMRQPSGLSVTQHGHEMDAWDELIREGWTDEEKREANDTLTCIPHNASLNEVDWKDEDDLHSVASIVTENTITPSRGPLTLRLRMVKRASPTSRNAHAKHRQRVACAKHDLWRMYTLWFSHETTTT